MLKLELEKEGFKRYNNGKVYLITIDTRNKTFAFYNIFRDDSVENKYIPNILTDPRLEPLDESYFSVDKCIYIKSSKSDVVVEELEKYLTAFKIAQESIEEFKQAIQNKEI